MPDKAGLPAASRRAFRLAYALGAVLCVALPLVLQVVLRQTMRPGVLGLEAIARELGYTFTGLTALALLGVLGRSKRMRVELPALSEARRPRRIFLEILLQSTLLGLSAVYGLVTFGLGGPAAERYARTFIALPIVMFLVFIPRESSFRHGDPED